MADWQEALGGYAGPLALAACVLACAALIFLILVFARQKRADRRASRRHEGLQRQLEENARNALGRVDYTALSESQAARLMQAMEERGRDEALRFSDLSGRLDTFGESQDQRFHRFSAQLEEKLTQNEARVESMRRTLDQSVTRLQEENTKKLEEMRQTVDEKLHATLDKRLGESFSLVNERLEQVYKGLGEMQSLASGVGDLKKVLTNVKTRGVWGEMQLGTLLAQVLSPSQYEENVAVVPGSSQRVEFAVKLPGQGEGFVYLPIDSKFPIEDYERLLNAYEIGDQAVIAAASSALQTALKVEAKRIASKYIEPPHTTDFAIMFLPIEGLYAEALRSRGLTEELQEKLRIVVAGPTTLNALLTSLQVGFRTLAIEQRTGEVWQLLSAVKTEFGKFSLLLDSTQKKLRVAADSIETASRKTRTIERKLRRVEAIDPGEAARLLEEEADSELPALQEGFLPEDGEDS
ncbi:MAG: DNA recombination protein RmuC [Clostridiales bacterium]|nr:DNA recombination protein RmuC [Clostridiales bacterium]